VLLGQSIIETLREKQKFPVRKEFLKKGRCLRGRGEVGRREVGLSYIREFRGDGSRALISFELGYEFDLGTSFAWGERGEFWRGRKKRKVL